MQADDLAILELCIIFGVDLLIWVNDVVKTILFAVDECILNRNWLALLDRTYKTRKDIFIVRLVCGIELFDFLDWQ